MGKPRSRNSHAPKRPGPNSEGTDRYRAGVFADLLPHLWRFRTQFRDGRDADKVLRAALRLGTRLFRRARGLRRDAPAGRRRGNDSVPDPPADSWWDRQMLAGFLRGRQGARSARADAGPHPAARANVGGAGGAVGQAAAITGTARQAFSSIGALANELIDQIDQERVREVRARVDRKILEQSLPKHLFYEVLHGIRSLTAYDHSAALLTYDDERRRARGGRRAGHLAEGERPERGAQAAADAGAPRHGCAGRLVCGFDRDGRDWNDWTGTDATPLAELLDFDGHAGPSGLSPREGAILCAPLVTRAGLLGVLKVAAVHAGAFSQYEVELVSQFLPQAAVALQNARRAESLQQRVLIAERKHAMADLARGVSHDVNNALGAVLPLVQQLREEIDQGTLRSGRRRGRSRPVRAFDPGLSPHLRRDAQYRAGHGPQPQ